MKKQLHPDNYNLVVYEDLNNGYHFLTKSTASSDETIKWEDGNTYPLIKIHVSSASHPFYTGEERILDIEGRVDKFKARAAAAKVAKERKIAQAKKKKVNKAKATKKIKKEETVTKIN